MKPELRGKFLFVDTLTVMSDRFPSFSELIDPITHEEKLLLSPDYEVDGSEQFDRKMTRINIDHVRSYFQSSHSEYVVLYDDTFNYFARCKLEEIDELMTQYYYERAN
jgi:hypothetical protein